MTRSSVAAVLAIFLGFTLANGQSLPSRPSGSLVDPSNALSRNLAGLFVMNEATGTTDKNLVTGQNATAAGSTVPTWNIVDPSLSFNGGASLKSYMNAGTDLTFDQLTPNKITLVAKVYVNALAAAGIAEKNDSNSIDSGFVFGFDGSGALQLMVERSSVDMTAKTAAGAVTAGQWIQVAFTWDGTTGTASAAHLFVNGVEQTKTTAADGSGTIGYLHATTNPFRVGNASFGPTGSLNGKIAYLAVYKYRILTSTELNQLDSQLPITTNVITPISESGTPVTATSATSGQALQFPFQGWNGQAVGAQFTNNTLGSVTVNLVAPDGTILTSTSSAAAIFSLPASTLPIAGNYDVVVQPSTGASGSITSNLVLQGARAPGSSVDTSSPLSANLTGLFVMNEGTGTTDKNVVDGQSAVFSGTTQPAWNAVDPSIAFVAGGSLASYLNAGTDLNFDQLTPNKMTLVAKVFVNTLGTGGISEKNDGNTVDSGFVFGLDGTGAMQLMVEKSAADMSVKTAAGAVAPGQWVQVAFTWDGTVGTAASAHFFVNGAEASKATSSNGSGTLGYSHATNNPFRIGNASFGPTGAFNGKIAYLAVYRGRILTSSELTTLDSQLPITNSVITPISESGTSVTATTTQAGQDSLLPFQGWSGQQITVQLNNNTMGALVVSLLKPDGTALTSASSSASTFSLPAATLSSTGVYNVSIRPAGNTTGSVDVSLLVPGARLGRSVLDESNPLSASLVGLFVMGEGTGVVDSNLVNGQSGAFSGSSLPAWNATDPSVVIGGGGYLNSYLDAGADLNFDALTPGKMTLVAKVMATTLTSAGIAAKNDGDTVDSGFVFGWDATGALRLTVEKSVTNMQVQSAAGTIQPNQWTQIAVTWDGTVGASAAAHLYVNGVEQSKSSSADGSGNIGYSHATNEHFRIGTAQFDVPGSLPGKIAYLAVYKGRVLTPTELNQIDSRLPIDNVDVSGTIPTTGSLPVTIAAAGQNARLLLPATAGQNLIAWIFNNTLGALTATLYNVDGTVLSTTTSAASGLAPPVVPAPTTGTYAVYIRPNGATTGSMSVTAVPPSTPTVSIASPASGSQVYLSSPPTLTANPATTNGASVSKVDYYEGQTLVGTVTTAPYSLVLNAPSPGTHSYVARVTDSNDMTGQSSATNVTWALPQITGFSPAGGLSGTQVTITGVGFGSQTNNSIAFNGVTASTMISWSDNQIVALVPPTASTGPIKTFFNSSFEVDSSTVFEVPNPAITAVSPPAGSLGGTITVTGSGFGSANWATINGVNTVVGMLELNGIPFASISSWNDTQIVATIPLNGSWVSGNITVIRFGITSNGVPFAIEGPPAVSGLSPTSGPPRGLVVISGSGFGPSQGNSTVALNGVPATVNNWSDTQISAVVPPGSETGPFSVTVASITGTSQDFIITNSVQVTDSLGNVTNYVSGMVGGAWYPRFSQGGGCSSCSVRGSLNREFDGIGNVLSNTDELQHKTFYAYDANGNVTSETQYLDPNTPAVTSYTYNSFGEPLTVTDPLGNVTNNTYDRQRQPADRDHSCARRPILPPASPTSPTTPRASSRRLPIRSVTSPRWLTIPPG